METDPIKFILTKLPEFVVYENRVFVFSIFINHTYEMRLCYELQDDDGSGWKNPFLQDKNCCHLYLFEVIKDIPSLNKSVHDCYDFLVKNKLI